MPKGFLVSLILATLILTAYLTLAVNNAFVKTSPSKSEIDTAINQARYLFSQRKKLGEDFSNGPCLSEALLPDWVVDIAHNPRIPVDDLPQNQCQSFREGRVKHFVELDVNGNLIRAQ